MIIDKALRVVVQIALSEHLETQLFRGPIYLSIVYAQSLASASATTLKLVISLNIWSNYFLLQSFPWTVKE